MASRKPAQQTRIEIAVSARLMARVTAYARRRGTTPEAVLLQSIQAFLDTYPLPEDDRASGGDR
jgi:hypothetical protein